MLYITRKVNQKVLIGNEVEVEIHQIQGEEVIVKFTAPKRITIKRAEAPLRLNRIRTLKRYKSLYSKDITRESTIL